MKASLGLQGRVALIATAVIVFAFVAITVAAGISLRDGHTQAMQQRSLAIAKSLRLQLERLLQYGIKLEDLAGFEEQCREAVRAYEGIGSALVVSRDGRVLFHSDAARIGAEVHDPRLAAAVKGARETVLVTGYRDREYYATVVPLTSRDGDHLAGVVITVPTETVYREIRRLAIYGAIVGLVVLSVGIALLLAALSAFANRSLQALARSEASLAHAQELARVGSWEWDCIGGLAVWSEQVYRILGLDAGRDAADLRTFLQLVPEEQRPRLTAAFTTLLKQGGEHSLEHAIVRRDGVERMLCQQAEAVRDAEGRMVLVRGTLQDITERNETERKIASLAYYDTLTGLPNRLKFKDDLARALHQAERGHDLLAVMFLDLDRFKHINDTLGHSAGDQLLKEVAARLDRCVRASDEVGRSAAEETMARLGGDEFTVLLTGLGRPEDAAKVAQRIVAELARPFTLEGQELFVSTSLGIALYPADGTDIDTLLKNADAAMYHAKDLGRNNYQFYSRELNARAMERLTLERDLHRALERNEFMLHYQPQVDFASGCVTGVEALLRWNHPQRGLVPPGQFIPIAEQTGLIVPIGDWVLEEACRQGRAWSEQGLEGLEVWVNVSGIQFRDRHLVGAVRQALERSGLEPGLLVVEATETIMLENRDGALGTLRELKALGIGIALDDFGTGYSSLAYLKRFPLDTLKIDGSFVRDLDQNAEDRAIVHAIIAMAASLELDVVAEGVETPQQAARLAAMGCRRMQGYHFCRPLRQEAIAAFVAGPALKCAA